MIDYWIDVGLQMKKQLCACETLESFIMVLIFVMILSLA